MMSQRRFYHAIILGLVALNVVVLAFFLLTKPRPPHHATPDKLQSEIIKDLRLDQQQATVFTALANEHRQQMTAVNERQEELLLPYFESLTGTSENINTDSLLTLFQQAEREKLEVTYQHFQEIKGILKQDQLTDFEVVINKITRRILSGKQKRPSPPEGF